MPMGMSDGVSKVIRRQCHPVSHMKQSSHQTMTLGVGYFASFLKMSYQSW